MKKILIPIVAVLVIVSFLFQQGYGKESKTLDNHSMDNVLQRTNAGSISLDRTVYPVPWEDRQPLKQFNDGIDSHKIQCRKDLHLVIKTVDGSPACVKQGTLQKLRERGWAVHISDKIQVTGNDAQKICDVLDFDCPSDQIFYGVKSDNGIIVEQQTDDGIYRFDVYPNEFCYSKNGWGIGLCRIAYPTITIASTKHDPNPNSIILQIGVNNTTYWKNESEMPVTLISEDSRWSSGLIPPNDGKIIQFNQTAFYEYDGHPQTAINGRIAILSDQTQFLPIREKLAIAREIIKVDMGPPITAIGIGNADNVLAVKIHENELKKNPDAEEFYTKKYREMIPFEVPIRITFGHIEAE